MRIIDVMMGKDEIELRDKVAAELYIATVIANRGGDTDIIASTARTAYAAANLFLEARRKQLLIYAKVIE